MGELGGGGGVGWEEVVLGSCSHYLALGSSASVGRQHLSWNVGGVEGGELEVGRVNLPYWLLVQNVQVMQVGKP